MRFTSPASIVKKRSSLQTLTLRSRICLGKIHSSTESLRFQLKQFGLVDHLDQMADFLY